MTIGPQTAKNENISWLNLRQVGERGEEMEDENMRAQGVQIGTGMERASIERDILIQGWMHYGVKKKLGARVVPRNQQNEHR